MFKLIDLTNRTLTWIAVVALFLLMASVTFDVVVRNLGLYHVRGMMDYISLFLALTAGGAIPVAFIVNRHLVVELGTFALSHSNKLRLEAVWLLLGVPVLGGLGWLVLHEGVALAGRGQKMGVLGWSPMVFHGLVAAALVLSAVACAVMAAVKLRGEDSALPE